MISAQEAINRLKEGNERFVSGSPLLESLANPERRSELAAGQEPFAIILGCSDSRVPIEIVFDQGLGDIFAIRARRLVRHHQVRLRVRRRRRRAAAPTIATTIATTTSPPPRRPQPCWPRGCSRGAIVVLLL